MSGISSLGGGDTTPAHEVSGTSIRFQQPDGTWGAWMDLTPTDGAPGASAYQVAVAAGFVGTEAEWLASLQGLPGADSMIPGPSGLSAYQVAVAAGFVGTEAAWLASLQGADGVNGSAGNERLFTVHDGESVTAGTVANFSGGKIGANPVVNSGGSHLSDGSNTFSITNASGTVGLRGYKNGSGHHCVEAYLIGDSSLTPKGETVVNTGSTFVPYTAITLLDDDKFLAWGTKVSTGASTAYFFAVKFEVNPTTGAVSVGSARNWSAGSNHASSWMNVHCFGNGYFGIKRQSYQSGNTYWYNVYDIAGLNLTDISATSAITVIGVNGLAVASNTKAINPTTSSTWNIVDINGSSVSNNTTISTGLTSAASNLYIHRIPSTDTFVFAYINTSTQLVLETFEFSGGNLNAVANSRYVVVDDASGVTVGGIAGTSTGVVLTYENGSKGYADSFSLDAGYKVSGAGISYLNNVTNYAPKVQYSGANDIYRIWWNEATANARAFTVNAYASSVLIPMGIVNADAVGPNTTTVTFAGPVAGFSGLIPGEVYYYDTALYDGSVTLVNTGVEVGRALTDTEMMLS